MQYQLKLSPEIRMSLAHAETLTVDIPLDEYEGSLRALIEYIDEGEPDLEVVKAEIGETILRMQNKYAD